MRKSTNYTGLLTAMIIQANHDYQALCRIGIILEGDKVVDVWPKYVTTVKLQHGGSRTVAKRFSTSYEHKQDVEDLIEFVRRPPIARLLRVLKGNTYAATHVE